MFNTLTPSSEDQRIVLLPRWIRKETMVLWEVPIREDAPLALRDGQLLLRASSTPLRDAVHNVYDRHIEWLV